MNGLQLRLLRCLHDANAPFLVIGGFAIRALGSERQTVDVDLIVSTAHAVQTLAGIAAFSPGVAAPLTVAQLELRNKRVMLESQRGHEGDILTSVGELDFEELYARRYIVQFNGLAVTFASAVDRKRAMNPVLERGAAL